MRAVYGPGRRLTFAGLAVLSFLHPVSGWLMLGLAVAYSAFTLKRRS